jgi:prepilin-type N-terminal cleavage/methylation domain-containing protein
MIRARNIMTKGMSALTRHAPRRRRRRRHRGVGLPELLIALAISAALLTATAVAVDASFKAYGVNQSQAQLAQRVRVAMHRITTYIRTTAEHRPDNDEPIDDFVDGTVCTDTAIRMMTGEDTGVIFRQAGDTLQMVPFTIVGGALVEGQPNALLRGVQAGDFSITFEPMRSARQIRLGRPEYDQLKRASILLTLRPDASTVVAGEERIAEPVTLSTSVMPRKNFW